MSKRDRFSSLDRNTGPTPEASERKAQLVEGMLSVSVQETETKKEQASDSNTSTSDQENESEPVNNKTEQFSGTDSVNHTNKQVDGDDSVTSTSETVEGTTSELSTNEQEQTFAIVKNVMQTFEKQRKLTVEETHTRQTYLIKNTTLQKLNKLSRGKRKGYKTELVNFLLEQAVDQLLEKTEKNERNDKTK